MKRCTLCQKVLPDGTKAKYCSAACKQIAYRQRLSIANRNASALHIQRETSTNDGYPALKGGAPDLRVKNPPVRYVGSKWRIAEWIIDQFPPHTCYVEPFAGGASVLIQKPRSKLEVLNDLNGDVVNFFDMLREKTADLVRAIQLTPYHEGEYIRAHEPGCTDLLERARRFYVRTRMSFGSSEAFQKSGWRYQTNTTRNLTLTDEFNRVDHLWATADRLKQVQISCTDYKTCIKRFDTPGTLFYVDPPYPASTRYETRNYYRHEMLEDQLHVEMAEVLKSLEGMVIVSGYECDLYRDLFTGWRMIQKPTRANGNASVTECLWIAPAVDRAELPLFRSVGL